MRQTCAQCRSFTLSIPLPHLLCGALRISGSRTYRSYGSSASADGLWNNVWMSVASCVSQAAGLRGPEGRGLKFFYMLRMRGRT
jgi:hypothetical protein